MRAFITLACLFLAALSQIVAAVANGIFLPTSGGDWLSLLALHGYGISRTEATFATGSLTLTNSGGGVYVVDAGDLIFSNDSTGKTYRNTSTFALSPAVGLVPFVLSVPIQAVEAGAAGSALAGAVSQIETTLLGVTCSNAAALIGTEQETDSDLRLRCSASLGALSPSGTADSYAYAARSAVRPVDGSAIGVTRTRIVPEDPATHERGTGHVSVYMATPSGGVESPDLAVIQASFARNAQPAGVTSHALSATKLEVPVQYTAYVYSDASIGFNDFLNAAKSALTAFFAAQPIGGNIADSGGKIYSEMIKSVIQDVAPNHCYHVALTVPVGDVTLDAYSAPVCGEVLATLHYVDRNAAA